jgi:hypothetical protein
MPEHNKQHGINDLLMRTQTPETPENNEQTSWDDLSLEEQADMVVAEQQAETTDAMEVLAEEIKENLDHLIKAYLKKDKRRTLYRVGQISRQMVDLGRKCVDLPALKEAGGLILPEGKEGGIIS